MKQTARIISTYASDVSGVCSALFELGGMTVMHDASGCNSTYNTHDEPRWYDMDSMVYISGLSEMEAIMGDDEKLIGDIVSASKELNPKFIAVAGSPIPMMTGTDFPAIASIINQRTGLPTFGFPTNGMHSYLSGASMAFKAVATQMTLTNLPQKTNAVNILGVTPLDFSVNGSVESIRDWLVKSGFEVVSSWGMGSSLDKISQAGCASVNLVVSYCGLAAAKELQRKFGTPFVIGVPIGGFADSLAKDLQRAQESSKDIVSCVKRKATGTSQITIIGESVYSGSLAAAVADSLNLSVRVICPLETQRCLLADCDIIAQDEDEIIPLLSDPQIVIADPLYKPICNDNCRFIPLPSEGFSGRIFRKDIPNLIEDFDKFTVILRSKQ